MLHRIPEKKREPHVCTPVPHEAGRYYVNSASAAKQGKDESYIVDVLAEEVTADFQTVKGTCGCKGYSVRRTCSHLDDAKKEHARLELLRSIPPQ